MTFKKLTQAEKNKIRRKAIEAITDENYGDDGDNFHEHATAQAVISLLDELELKTEQRANWCAMAKKLGEDLDAAEKRIAELETREVTLPAQKFCPGEYAGSVLWSETEVWNQAIYECTKAIRAAGIGKGE